MGTGQDLSLHATSVTFAWVYASVQWGMECLPCKFARLKIGDHPGIVTGTQGSLGGSSCDAVDDIVSAAIPTL